MVVTLLIRRWLFISPFPFDNCIPVLWNSYLSQFDYLTSVFSFAFAKYTVWLIFNSSSKRRLKNYTDGFMWPRYVNTSERVSPLALGRWHGYHIASELATNFEVNSANANTQNTNYVQFQLPQYIWSIMRQHFRFFLCKQHIVIFYLTYLHQTKLVQFNSSSLELHVCQHYHLKTQCHHIRCHGFNSCASAVRPRNADIKLPGVPRQSLRTIK